MRFSPRRYPYPFLFLAVLALLAALWAGLLRLGWQLPPLTPSLAMAHGPLMISGFLGTLIMLERAVALRKRWMYLPPLLSALGGLLTLLLRTPPLGPALITLASLGGVAILIAINRREFALHTATMLLGALTWFAGNLLWLFGRPIPQVVLFWLAFLVLTIAGERLELSRVLNPPRLRKTLFSAVVVIFLAGLVLSIIFIQLGTRIIGAALLFIAIWSLRNDIAWRNLKHRIPLTRYIAWCLALGLSWLGISGGLILGFGAQIAGTKYDAFLHAVFVGFVISMIFGHAPIIFPAILGRKLSYYPAFYLHLILLHASLILRILADYAGLHTLRSGAGMANTAAILIFLAMTIYSIQKR